jgi:imidazole glycerol-phosphate synthase subunit HisH
VYNALDLLGAEVQISSKPEDVLTADHLVLPGVGAFGLAMENLRQLGLVDALNEKIIHQHTPILAICLGMELLAEDSNEHGFHQGLGWLPGHIRLFEDIGDLRVPHVGWNDITLHRESPLLNSQLGSSQEFYFVHSYEYATDDPSTVVATAEYGREFVVAVHRDNIFGTQFHPEKSQELGLRVLRNFIQWQPIMEAAL